MVGKIQVSVIYYKMTVEYNNDIAISTSSLSLSLCGTRTQNMTSTIAIELRELLVEVNTAIFCMCTGEIH